MVTVEDLGKRYASRWILRGISFQVEPGQCLAVVGPNGCGKSTLLKLITGLLTPTEGCVHTQDFGYAALDLALYPSLSAREHLEFAGRLRHKPARADAWLERVGLAGAEDRLAQHMSSGMRARLRLALALQAEGPVLFLDEPGAALDEHGRRLVADIVDRRLERGCVLLATNDPSERELATHELVLAG